MKQKGIHVSHYLKHPYDQTFHQIDGDTNPPTHRLYASTSLWRFLRTGIHDVPIRRMIFEIELIRQLLNHGLEQHRLDRLTQEQIDEPVIVCEHKDGKHTLVDGSHRLMRRVYARLDFFDCYVVPPEVWEHFIVYGDGLQDMLQSYTPETLQNSKSYL